MLSHDPAHDDNLIITTDDAGYGDSTLGEQVVAGLERQGHRVTRIGPIRTLGFVPSNWEATYMERLRDVVERARRDPHARQVLFIDALADFRVQSTTPRHIPGSRLGIGRVCMEWLSRAGPAYGVMLVVHEHAAPPTWLVGCEPLHGLGLYQVGDSMVARVVRREACVVQRGIRLGEVEMVL